MIYASGACLSWNPNIPLSFIKLEASDQVRSWMDFIHNNVRAVYLEYMFL